MPVNDMHIREIGDLYELEREQWQGHVARISKDLGLLEEIKKYTWTYTAGKHPYLRNCKLGISMHEFVLSYIYGKDNVKRMRDAGNIIEHLDNDGLNCTYENLHILSEDLNKAKAFTIDKRSKDFEDIKNMPAFILDVYFLHDKECFQMQIFMNNDIYFNINTKRAVEMFICRYDGFEDLYLDWFYLLECLAKKIFDINKMHADKIFAKERIYIQIAPEEENSPIIIRDGVVCLNLDAKKDGKPMAFVSHTSLRNIEDRMH